MSVGSSLLSVYRVFNTLVAVVELHSVIMSTVVIAGLTSESKNASTIMLFLKSPSVNVLAMSLNVISPSLSKLMITIFLKSLFDSVFISAKLISRYLMILYKSLSVIEDVPLKAASLSRVK